MASCMECIHFNPCNMRGNIIVEKPTEGNDWGLHNEVEKECKYFTPTADVVEVVRCKDCKRCYEKRTKLNKQLMRFCMRMDGNEYQVNANDFCSYGTPKERGVYNG